MTKFFETTDSKLDKLVDEMASNEFEHTSMRNKVFNSLKDLHHLTMTDKMKVTSAICDRKDFEIFLTPTPENMDMLIKLIMDGQNWSTIYVNGIAKNPFLNVEMLC